jgi:hypothetical protein
MSRAKEIRQAAAAAGAAVLCMAVALALSPGAGGSYSRASKVDVVGAGTLNW